MRKKALRKDFRVEIRKSLNRFLSIFFIVALGVAFYSGIQASAPSMRKTGDAYFDANALMDIRVMGTLGLTDDDLDAIREIEGIERVSGCYMEDVYCGEGDTKVVLHVESMADGLNKLEAARGELPDESGECFLDELYAQEMGYEPGDKIEITVEDEEDSFLKRREFTVSGCGYSPTYISFERGSTSLGTGSLSGFLYVLPEDFDADVYSVAYAGVKGARDEIAFTDGYDDLVEEVYDRVEAIADARCDIRYDEVMDEAQEKLDDARQEVEDGNQELADAKKELEDGKAEAESELAEAESELLDGEEQLSEGKMELNDAALEVADGEKSLQEGEAELAENESTIADAKQQIADGERELAAGEEEYEDGLSEYKKEKKKATKQLKAAQKQVDDGTAQLESGWQSYETGLAQIQAGETQLAAAKQQLELQQAQLVSGWQSYQADLAALEEREAQYEAERRQVEEQQAQYDAESAQLEQMRAEYEQAADSLPGLTDAYEEAQAQVQSLTDSAAALESQIQAGQENYSRTESDAAAKRDEQAAAGENAAQLNNQYSEKEQEKAGLQSRLDAIPGEIGAQDAVIGDAARTEEERNAAAQRKSELEQEKADLENKIQALNNEMGGLTGQIQIAVSNEESAAGEVSRLESALAGISEEIESAGAALDGTQQELETAQDAVAQLQVKISEINAEKQTLEQQAAQLGEAGAQLQAAWNQINAKEAEIVAGYEQLETAKDELEATEAQLYDAQQEIDDGYQELKKAKAKLRAAQKSLESGWSQIQSSRSQLADGERRLADGREQLADARTELADAREQLADGRRELAESRQTIREGWEEYEKGKQDAQEQIADGEEKIADAEQKLKDAQQEIDDAQKELDELKFPEWYVDDRNALPEHSGFGENAQRVGNLAQVVPVLFFLVAALISLTTMTRMVEEERTQIGTLKALGYSKASIASKYLKYAFYATLGGSVAGVLIGEKLLPWVIINAYGIIYVYLPEILVPYDWSYALISAGTALICTIGATLLSCYRELRAVPAELMRPPAPKQGKRVLLERIPFFWNHLSFSWKSTVRNLIRYKKRFLMTVFGIGGCMALLLVGYGLQDSIMDIGVLQFDELQQYDAMMILDTDASKAEQEAVWEMVQEEGRISDAKQFYMQQEEIDAEGVSEKEWYVYVYVPEDTENLENFVRFRNRETKEEYELTDEGAIITEKVADELGIRPGDVISLKQDGEEDIQIPITAVCENYLSHYVYMTPALYEQVYGEAPQYNSIFWKSPEEEAVVEQIGETMLAQDAVLNITYTRTMAGQIDSMIGAMDIVMVVLIISAGMLAFVVLYNLNNININERRRELATLKVLGFFNGEVAVYVYRENIILTAIGAILGCVLGKLLHAYVITTVEVDICMFGRNINVPSFIYAVLFTIGFSVIVNLAMYFKLKKIDMVESLKSIE